MFCYHSLLKIVSVCVFVCVLLSVFLLNICILWVFVSDVRVITEWGKMPLTHPYPLPPPLPPSNPTQRERERERERERDRQTDRQTETYTHTRRRHYKQPKRSANTLFTSSAPLVYTSERVTSLHDPASFCHSEKVKTFLPRLTNWIQNIYT